MLFFIIKILPAYLTTQSFYLSTLLTMFSLFNHYKNCILLTSYFFVGIKKTGSTGLKTLKVLAVDVAVVTFTS